MAERERNPVRVAALSNISEAGPLGVLVRHVRDLTIKVNEIDEDVIDTKAVAIRLESVIEKVDNRLEDYIRSHSAPIRTHTLDRVRGPTRVSDPAPPSPEEFAEAYGLKAGNTGSFKITPQVMAQITQRLHDLDQQKIGVEEFTNKLQKRFKLIVTIIGVVGPAIAWVLTHFLHL